LWYNGLDNKKWRKNVQKVTGNTGKLVWLESLAKVQKEIQTAQSIRARSSAPQVGGIA